MKLARPSAPALIAVAFWLMAVWLGASLGLIDDEAYITWMGARALRDAPLAAFFFQKFHPTLSALYAPFVGFGWRGFLVVHSAVGALGVYLAGALARRLGLPGGVAAAVLAISPVYLLAAASGQSNSDGVTLLLLSMWLAAGRPSRVTQALAGVSLAAALWSRYELALAVVLLGLGDAVRGRSRGVFVGLAAGASAYLLGGALYHHDPTWWFRFSPTLLTSLPGVHIERLVPRTFEQVRQVASQLSTVSVAWVAAASVPAAALGPRMRGVRVAFWITLAAMVGMPFARVLNFIHSPRYLSVVLPFAALLASAWVASPPPPRRGSVVAAALALLALLGRGSLLEPGLVCAVLLLLVVRARDVSVRAALSFALVATASAITLSTTPLLDNSHAGSDVLRAARWIARHHAGREVYTNDQHLALTLRAKGLTPRYLVAFDIQLELMRLLNPENGQRARVLRAISPYLYGHAAWACEIERRPPQAGALFALGPDERLLQYFPPEAWARSTALVGSFGTVSVRAMLPAGPPLRSSPRAELRVTPAQLALPCEVLGITAARGAEGDSRAERE